MKKVLFVLVSLLLVSYCFALESAPSNKVGYVKVPLLGGTGFVYTQFGLPFVFWDVPTGNVPNYGVESRKPSDIIGTQTFCGAGNAADRIIRQDNGEFAFRSSTASCNWTNTLETNPADMEPGRAYWVRAQNQAAGRFLVLAGEADITATGIPTVAINAGGTTNTYTPYSWRDPRTLARNTLNLRAQGFTGGTGGTSDRVLEQGSGNYFYYLTGTSAWGGTLPEVTPGQSYWIISKHNPTWNYTYNASGAQLNMPEGNLPAVKSVSTQSVKTTPAAPAVKANAHATK